MSDNTQLIRAIQDAAANATAAARSASAAAGNASKAALAAQGAAGSASAAAAAAALMAGATVTPTPNKIPIADGSGKLDPGWIPGGSGSPAPESNIAGLDFIIGEGNTPILEETQDQTLVSFLKGVQAGDDTTYVHASVADQYVDIESADELYLYASGEMFVEGSPLNVAAHSSGDLFLTAVGGTVHLGSGTGDRVDLGGGTSDDVHFLGSQLTFDNATTLHASILDLLADNFSLHGNGSGAIGIGGMGDTVDIEGSIILVHGYKIFNPVKGSDINVAAPTTVAPGTDGVSEYVVNLAATSTLQLLDTGPPMAGQLVRLILPATNGFVLTILDSASTDLFDFPSALSGGNAAAATFRYTDAGWIFCGSEYVSNT